MKRILLSGLAALALAGCVSQAEIQARKDARDWSDAVEVARIMCEKYPNIPCEGPDVYYNWSRRNDAANKAAAADHIARCARYAHFGFPFSYGNRTMGAIETGCLMGY